MSEFAPLLPPNATDAERGVERAGRRLDQMAVPVRHLWNPDTCPAAHLPWLAWALSVDIWDTTWPETSKREVLRRSVAVHRRKGTVGAVRDALGAVGYRDVRILENRHLRDQWVQAGGDFLSGDSDLDGEGTLSAPGASFRIMTRHWAEYIIDLDITEGALTPEAQKTIRRLADLHAPLRAHLAGLLYRMLIDWLAEIRLADTRIVVTVPVRGCDQFEVPSFRTIGHGCEALGGTTVPDVLDGSGPIAAVGTLSGEMALGEPLDHGWGNWAARLSSGLRVDCGGAFVAPVEYLDGSGETETLDGRDGLLVELIDGADAIDGDDTLAVADLQSFQPHVIDGTDTLGRVDGASGIWSQARMTIRRHGRIFQEAA